MKTEKIAAFTTLLAAIAAALGADWKAGRNPDYDEETGWVETSETRLDIDADGDRLVVRSHKKQEYSRLYGWFNNNGNPIQAPAQPDAITVARKRTPESIAADIKKRILPAAKALQAFRAVQWADHEAQVAAHAKAAADFTRGVADETLEWKETQNQHGELQSTAAHVKSPQSGLTLTVTARGVGVTGDASPELARLLAALVKAEREGQLGEVKIPD